MNDPISRLEVQLERLIEGAFAQVFGKTIRPQDIALRLSRAMEECLQPSDDGDPRPFAPDQYNIRLNKANCEALLARQPMLPTLLSQHMVQLALYADVRLRSTPRIDFTADALLAANELIIDASHNEAGQAFTAVIDKVEPTTPPIAPAAAPRNPQLVINGKETLLLEQPIINIGRSRDNQVVLDDLFVSRHHVQLRLRFGRYTLFDTNSQGGTRVNDVQVKEHRLQASDVIRIGRTQIVYLEDAPLLDGQTGMLNAPVDADA